MVYGCLFTYLVEDNLQELSSENETFTPSDVERALWSSAMETKQLASHPDAESKVKPSKSSKRKRKPWFSDAQVDINACKLFVLTLFTVSSLCPYSLRKPLTLPVNSWMTTHLHSMIVVSTTSFSANHNWMTYFCLKYYFW